MLNILNIQSKYNFILYYVLLSFVTSVFLQIKRHQAPSGKLHVPPESAAAKEQVRSLCCHSPCKSKYQNGDLIELQDNIICSTSSSPGRLLPRVVSPQPNGDGADVALPVGVGGFQPGAVLPATPDAHCRPPLAQRGGRGAAAAAAAPRCLLPRLARHPRFQDGGHLSDGGAQPEEGRCVSAEQRRIICLLFFSKLLLFVPAGSKQYSASIAFTLALFSHLVNHVNIRLQAELEDAESQVPPLPTDAAGKIGGRLFFYVSKQGRDVRSCLQGPPPPSHTFPSLCKRVQGQLQAGS